MQFGDLFIQLLSGLTRGMVLFLLASGLSLIFGALRVVNFSHGSFYMLAAFVAYSVVQYFSQFPSGNFWLALLIAPLVIAALGWLVETVLFRRVYRRDASYQLLLTYGLVLIGSDTVRLIWGEAYRSIKRPTALAWSFAVFDRPFPAYDAFLILVAAALGLGLWALLYRTKLGQIIRAVVHDRHMVSAMGVNVPALYSLVFALGCWLAAFAGGLYAPMGSIGLDMDINIIVECFAVVVVGGLGSISGALLGALIIGEVYAFGILVMPRAALAMIFIVMTVVLILRPHGLMGAAER